MRVRKPAEGQGFLERGWDDLGLETLDTAISIRHPSELTGDTHECLEDVPPAGAVGCEDDALAHELLEGGDLEGVGEDAVVVGELDLLSTKEAHHLGGSLTACRRVPYARLGLLHRSGIIRGPEWGLEETMFVTRVKHVEAGGC